MERLRRGHAALSPTVAASAAVRPEAGAGRLSRARSAPRRRRVRATPEDDVSRRQTTAHDGRPPDGQSKRAYRLALPAVFLVSLSILVFEVALTRIFSIMLSYHFV